MRRLGAPVAVPTAVRPLRCDERIRDRPESGLFCHADTTARIERETLLAGTVPNTALDRRESTRPPRIGEPAQHVLRRPAGCRSRVVGSDLDEGGEAPMRAAPLRVRMNAVI